MRKAIKCFMTVLFPVLLLASCEARIGEQKNEVEWYVIAIPTAVVVIAAFVIAGVALSKNTYVCSKCGHRFRPKWWKAAVSIHSGSDRVFKCPNCGNKGFCRKED